MAHLLSTLLVSSPRAKELRPFSAEIFPDEQTDFFSPEEERITPIVKMKFSPLLVFT